MNIVKFTLYVSVIVQVIALVIGSYAYYVDNRKETQMLDEIILIENIVQGIEFAFYFIIGFIFTNIPTKNLAQYRYYDWVITTPLMLLTTLLYFKFEDNKNKNIYTDVITSIKENSHDIIKIVLSNFGMLSVGYLQEIDKVPLLYSNIIGFGFLFYSFYILHKYVTTNISSNLFWIMFILWSLYGVAANYSSKIKNTAYNILDILSKNFYGIFLATIILYKN